MAIRITPVPREEIDRIARDGYRQHYGLDEPRPKAERPRNVRGTLLMVDGDRVEIPYRGRIYELLPVSFEDGVRLSDARATIEELEGAEPTKERIGRYVAVLRFVVSLAPKYLRPRGRVRRVFWRLTRNPFRGATDMEVGELLGFFLGCRMRSRVQYPAT